MEVAQTREGIPLKKRLFPVSAIAIATLGVLSSPASASATADVGVQRDCNFVARQDVKIRFGPSTDSGVLGTLRKGQNWCVDGSTTGGTYTACGGTSDVWAFQREGLVRFYVASTCLKWNE